MQESQQQDNDQSYQKKLLNINYYDLPWERIAEKYGQVNRGGYASWSEEVAFLYWLFSFI